MMRGLSLSLVIVFMASLALLDCTDKHSSDKPASSVSNLDSAAESNRKMRQSFVPPTAEQAYRLQDDCTRRGEAIIRENVIGSALTQEQVSRYNATTNRCYVRLEVHAADLDKWQDIDSSVYLEDGQTKEMLAFVTRKPNRVVTFLGFGCDVTGASACVEDKIAACMQGKECDPQ